MKVDKEISEEVDLSRPENQIKRKSWVGLIVAAAIGLGVGFWGGFNFNISAADYELDYSELDEIYSELKQNFDGEIKVSDLLDGAKKGFVQGLGDPYSQFFSRTEAKEFINDLEGEFTGVGIEILNKDGKLTVMNVLDDTPAATVGLKTGDLVAKVDDNETLDWAAEDAVKIIRGEAGTMVKITIIRQDSAMEFEIKRAAITSPSVKWEIKNNVGVLRVSRFADGDTANLAKKAAKEFVDKKVKGVVLDLRGNGGGYVSAAVDLASLWVDKGQIITSEKIGNTTASRETAKGNNILKGIDTVVLIDGGSASASEILAGALQDYKLATVLGTKSFGKGSVQSMKSLMSGNQLKLTVAKWWTPNDRNIDKTGIEPDEVVELDVERYKIDRFDSQLEKALEGSDDFA